MKRSDVKLEHGDLVVIDRGGEVRSARVQDVKRTECWVNSGSNLCKVSRDGSRHSDFPDFGALVTHVNGVAIDDGPRPLDKLEETINRAGERALKVATLTDKITAALRQFCARVESGEIRSKRTYAQFKQLLAEYEALS